ncbi:fluoride efflux transporter CrcB [Acinetobacter sp. B51(2017)]|uniref:fluoride efflux transporter CrcB n=1 Tax=Acinetobacter sp. B51(2017) TaxID=2060938 RepID=UPI000F075886|nr:fluoride efflux transporter CrcB [Acinetobacter sp. B51(2017)]
MTWLLVASGGAIGASLRYALGLYLAKPDSVFPWATWWINIGGCALAGIFFGLSQKYPSLQQEARLFFMVGILGGFTTFSSFGLETLQLCKQGQWLLAMSYALSSLVFGVLLLALMSYVVQR